MEKQKTLNFKNNEKKVETNWYKFYNNVSKHLEYPDVSLTIVQEAFSHALFDNRTEVEVKDFRQAIISSKNIYPDVIKKSMPEFDRLFAEQIELESQGTEKFERLSDDFAE